MRLGKVDISRKQLIGAALAWALVGGLLLMRSFNFRPETPAGASINNGVGSGITAAHPTLLTPGQTSADRGATTPGGAAQRQNTPSATGLSPGESGFPPASATSVVTAGLPGKSPQPVLEDEGGMYYFPLTTRPANPTATWYVKVFTPRPTRTPLPTYTPSNTPTPRATSTPRDTPTATPTSSPLPSATPSSTPTPTLTHTFSPTPSLWPTHTATATPTATSPAEAPLTGSLAFVSRGGGDGGDIVNLLQLPELTSAALAELDGLELCAWSADGDLLLAQLPRDDSGLTDLYTIALDGTLTPLTTALPGSSRCGDWGDGGRELYFPYTDLDGSNSLVELTLATGENRVVYQDGNPLSQARVAPDGNRLVFVTQNNAGSDLLLLELDSGIIQKLTNTPELEDTPRFSPDGRAVAFARKVDNEWALFILQLTTLEETSLPRVPGGQRQPDWLDDGQYLLFTCGETAASNICVYRLGAAAARILLPSPASIDSPLWRPSATAP